MKEILKINMKPVKLEQSYHEKKKIFHDYINNIKRDCKWDIYNIINPTLIKNPYASELPKRFFNNKNSGKNKKSLFLKTIFKYYLKSFYLFISYFIAFIVFKIYFKKHRQNSVINVIDIFALVDNINKNKKFEENYLKGIYEVFEKYKTDYTILLRPYGVNKNPFKLIKFFKIINKDKRDFIFEYELLRLRDFVELFLLVLVYPFKVLRLLQKEDSEIDKIFNESLIEDINNFNFESMTRYIFGKNISKIDTLQKIYSWSEFQVIERSFNYAIRKNNINIELIALQFFINYEIYFNTFVDDLDYEMLSSPHKVYVNGKYYILKRKKIDYEVGVSLRYKSIYTFSGIKKEDDVLLLGSYFENDTKYMLESVKEFDSVVFKNHPAVDINRFGKLSENIAISNENIYKLFETTKLVIGTASGTAVEAVACGVSVIIIASQDNLTANPLVEYGKGKIWDIAFSKDEIGLLYNQLLNYRENNKEEIRKISQWYKDNFFVEPTEENIIKVFELEKELKK